MATHAVLAEANHPDSGDPALVGAVRGDPADPTRATELIFVYGTFVDYAPADWRTHEYYLSVPLDNRGCPPPPLAYMGMQRTVQGIDQNLSHAQVRSVER